MQWYDAVKAGPTLRASTTAVAVDPDLAIALPGAGTWQFEVFLNYTGAAIGTGDLKIAMNYTGTSSFGVWAVNGIALGATTQANFGGNATGTSNTLAVGTNGGVFVTVDLKGTLYATSAGTLGMYWAQNTSSATSTALRQGCYLRARQIA
jgi:hypothetical protein